MIMDNTGSCTAAGVETGKAGEGDTPDFGSAHTQGVVIEGGASYAPLRIGRPANEDHLRGIDDAIEMVKADLRRKGSVNMQKERAELLRLYDRLRQRFSAYASDDMIADRLLELLDDELRRDA